MNEEENPERIDIDTAMLLAKEAARLAIEGEHSSNNSGSIIDDKTLKNLQGITTMFHTLKDLSSNPLNKAIEDKVGFMAAQVVENAFGHQQENPKDIMSQFMNSNLAYGIGQGIGNNTPSIIDSLTKNFGSKKTEQIIDNVIGSQRQIGQSGNPEQSNVEMLLSLDSNNPEHVSMYAESQGNISVDFARKMLMMHQDDIIKKMGQGSNQQNVINNQIQQVPVEQFYQSPPQQVSNQQYVQQQTTNNNESSSVEELLKSYMKDTSETMRQLTHEVIKLKEELYAVKNVQPDINDNDNKSVINNTMKYISEENVDNVIEDIVNAEIINNEYSDDIITLEKSDIFISPIKKGSVKKVDVIKDSENKS